MEDYSRHSLYQSHHASLLQSPAQGGATTHLQSTQPPSIGGTNSFPLSRKSTQKYSEGGLSQVHQMHEEGGGGSKSTFHLHHLIRTLNNRTLSPSGGTASQQAQPLPPSMSLFSTIQKPNGASIQHQQPLLNQVEQESQVNRQQQILKQKFARIVEIPKSGGGRSSDILPVLKKVIQQSLAPEQIQEKREIISQIKNRFSENFNNQHTRNSSWQAQQSQLDNNFHTENPKFPQPDYKQVHSHTRNNTTLYLQNVPQSPLNTVQQYGSAQYAPQIKNSAFIHSHFLPPTPQTQKASKIQLVNIPRYQGTTNFQQPNTDYYNGLQDKPNRTVPYAIDNQLLQASQAFTKPLVELKKQQKSLHTLIKQTGRQIQAIESDKHFLQADVSQLKDISGGAAKALSIAQYIKHSKGLKGEGSRLTDYRQGGSITQPKIVIKKVPDIDVAWKSFNEQNQRYRAEGLQAQGHSRNFLNQISNQQEQILNLDQVGQHAHNYPLNNTQSIARFQQPIYSQSSASTIQLKPNMILNGYLAKKKVNQNTQGNSTNSQLNNIMPMMPTTIQNVIMLDTTSIMRLKGNQRVSQYEEISPNFNDANQRNHQSAQRNVLKEEISELQQVMKELINKLNNIPYQLSQNTIQNENLSKIQEFQMQEEGTKSSKDLSKNQNHQTIEMAIGKELTELLKHLSSIDQKDNHEIFEQSKRKIQEAVKEAQVVKNLRNKKSLLSRKRPSRSQMNLYSPRAAIDIQGGEVESDNKTYKTEARRITGSIPSHRRITEKRLQYVSQSDLDINELTKDLQPKTSQSDNGQIKSMINNIQETRVEATQAQVSPIKQNNQPPNVLKHITEGSEELKEDEVSHIQESYMQSLVNSINQSIKEPQKEQKVPEKQISFNTHPPEAQEINDTKVQIKMPYGIKAKIPALIVEARIIEPIKQPIHKEKDSTISNSSYHLDSSEDEKKEKPKQKIVNKRKSILIIQKQTEPIKPIFEKNLTSTFLNDEQKTSRSRVATPNGRRASVHTTALNKYMTALSQNMQQKKNDSQQPAFKSQLSAISRNIGNNTYDDGAKGNSQKPIQIRKSVIPLPNASLASFAPGKHHNQNSDSLGIINHQNTSLIPAKKGSNNSLSKYQINLGMSFSGPLNGPNINSPMSHMTGSTLNVGSYITPKESEKALPVHPGFSNQRRHSKVIFQQNILFKLQKNQGQKISSNNISKFAPASPLLRPQSSISKSSSNHSNKGGQLSPVHELSCTSSKEEAKNAASTKDADKSERKSKSRSKSKGDPSGQSSRQQLQEHLHHQSLLELQHIANNMPPAPTGSKRFIDFFLANTKKQVKEVHASKIKQETGSLIKKYRDKLQTEAALRDSKVPSSKSGSPVHTSKRQSLANQNFKLVPSGTASPELMGSINGLVAQSPQNIQLTESQKIAKQKISPSTSPSGKPSVKQDQSPKRPSLQRSSQRPSLLKKETFNVAMSKMRQI
ncbi:hypothetical protein FGO68_gene548 [Halteria grandinella]|uniref:Uncharacterized protein n=1 Tax=Halteria grandinella TaxID=5974 RepID=A0A8J8P3A7_HALGN|nr:hypothetical protein FGO68_gene548 [Halteria grandinella]